MQTLNSPSQAQNLSSNQASTDDQTQSNDNRERGVVARSIVQVETNLLRFPFFALHTKGLRDIDAKEVRGTRIENGQSHEFVFRVSRNTDHLYPGPLSRKAHFALLSLLRKQGFPFRNPIAFTWRQLAREMCVAYSGATTISRLKDALHSTLGAMIKSSYALKEGESRNTLPARERGYLLYTECLFTNDRRSDGTLVEQNYVTLADWYLANLNSLYAAPIDYIRWNRLNDQSPLASRLYEFLLFNFSAKIDTFTINYSKLCQFLPAKVEPYASQAKEQLAPAFRLLTEEGIIGQVTWTTGQHDALQLQVARGDHLSELSSTQKPSAQARPSTNEPSSNGGGDSSPAVTAQQSPIHQPDLFDAVITHEHTSSLSPAERLVQQFHSLWNGSSTTDDDSKEEGRLCFSTTRNDSNAETDLAPSDQSRGLAPASSPSSLPKYSLGELTAAKECLTLYGLDLVTHLLPKVIKRMRQQFPTAKTFGATRPYFAELHTDHLKRQRIAEAAKSAHLEHQREADERQQNKHRHAALEAEWQSLTAAEQESIRQRVLAANPRLQLEKHPTILTRFCLNELAMRNRC